MSPEVVVDVVHLRVVGETAHPAIGDLRCLVADLDPGLDHRPVDIGEVLLRLRVVVEVLRSVAPGQGRIHLWQGSFIRAVQLQQKTR